MISENATKKVISAVESFFNTFEIEDAVVWILSAASVSPEISKDIETAEERGKQAKIFHK